MSRAQASPSSLAAIPSMFLVAAKACGAGMRRFGLLVALALSLPLALQAQEIRIGGTGAALGTMKQLAQAFQAQHPSIRITLLPSMGSGGGIRALAAGAIELAVSARVLSDSEQRAGLTAREYGRTPLVFATSMKTPAQNLSSAQVRDIFNGTTHQWPDGSPLRLVMRPAGDSDTDLLKAHSPELREAVSAAEKRSGMLIAVTDQDAAEAVERIPGALGMVTMALALSESRSLRPVRFNGFDPMNGAGPAPDYPLVKPLFLVTSAQPPDHLKTFLAFIASPAGRKILTRLGHRVP